MRHCYFKEINFWEAPVHLLDAGTWKFVAGGREKAKKHFRRRIVNRKDTSLWFDPWIKDGALTDHISRMNYILTSKPWWKVRKLIHHNSWNLSIPSLTGLCNLISLTDIHAHKEDSWYWTGPGPGQFSFKSAWNITRHTGSDFEFSNIIWFPSHCPKWQFVFWEPYKGNCSLWTSWINLVSFQVIIVLCAIQNLNLLIIYSLSAVMLDTYGHYAYSSWDFQIRFLSLVMKQSWSKPVSSLNKKQLLWLD